MVASHVESSLVLRRGAGDWQPVALQDRSTLASAEGLTVAVCTYRRPESIARFLTSLAAQERIPDRLVIVDASPDGATEAVVRRHAATAAVGETRYVRVSGPLRGLTRQRNVALQIVETDLVAFFDDDVVLLPGCLAELERVHRTTPGTVVGVGAYIENEFAGRPPLLWRIRARTGIVPSLTPGRYHRSGMSTPWSFLAPTAGVTDGDWLPGGAIVWRTGVARSLGFHSGFGGYAQGEDLEFSLRARRHGRLLLTSAGRVQHLHEPGGRPDAFRHGYMEIQNRYEIHRRAWPERRLRDRAWFAYAWGLDTAMLLRHLLFPRRVAPTVMRIAGRAAAALQLLWAGVTGTGDAARRDEPGQVAL